MGEEPRTVADLVAEARAAGDPTAWFDPIYAAAGDDPSRVPWARLAPHPYLLGYLDGVWADPDGARALVVGCGLGDDAEELARRGFDVVAFDVSERAIAWARERFPDSPVAYRVADLLALPDEWREGFDLVVEIRTLQSLLAEARHDAAVAIGACAAPGGEVMVSALLATSDEVARAWQGPPWALAPSELTSFLAAGLERVSLEHPSEPDRGGAMEVRARFRRPAG